MKKIFAILALAISTVAAADSVSLETRNVQGINSSDATVYRMAYKHDFSKSLAGDVVISQTQADTAAMTITTRVESGLAYSAPLFGSVKGYVRGAVGERFSTKGNTSYWVVEPGITMPIGPFNTRVGYRYRSSFDPEINNDQTHTARVSASYALTKQDAVGMRFDRQRGDSDQNIVGLFYTRSF